MSELNTQLFLWLNGSTASSAWLLELARFASLQLPQWLIAGSIGALIVGAPDVRRVVIRTFLAMLAALALARLLQHFDPMQRPFATHIGTALVDHAASASFPSTHATVAFAFAVMVAMSVRRPVVTWIVLGLAVLIAWSRVFLGLHYPLDVGVGAGIGAACAWLCARLPLTRALQFVDKHLGTALAVPDRTRAADDVAPHSGRRSGRSKP